jgi:hypothetical protein
MTLAAREATRASLQMPSKHPDMPASQARYTLTRAQVAERLGVSLSSVRRLEWDRLRPEVDDRGVHRFDPAEVEAIEPRPRAPARAPDPERRAQARKGRLAANAFRMFARHMTLPQIVVATKQPPEVIRELYREWSTGLDEGEWERRDRAGRL